MLRATSETVGREHTRLEWYMLLTDLLSKIAVTE